MARSLQCLLPLLHFPWPLYKWGPLSAILPRQKLMKSQITQLDSGFELPTVFIQSLLSSMSYFLNKFSRKPKLMGTGTPGPKPLSLHACSQMYSPPDIFWLPSKVSCWQRLTSLGYQQASQNFLLLSGFSLWAGNRSALQVWSCWLKAISSATAPPEPGLTAGGFFQLCDDTGLCWLPSVYRESWSTDVRIKDQKEVSRGLSWAAQSQRPVLVVFQLWCPVGYWSYFSGLTPPWVGTCFCQDSSPQWNTTVTPEKQSSHCHLFWVCMTLMCLSDNDSN